LPKRVITALAHTINYLSAFGLADALLETKFFNKFTTRAHMLLAANTLANLEIYRNETDKSTHGSLMWILDRTKTKFGARLLRDWVGRPLVDKRYNRCIYLRKHLLIFLTVFFRTVSMPLKSSKGVRRRNWLLFVRF
jgi:hypothetical protein